MAFGPGSCGYPCLQAALTFRVETATNFFPYTFAADDPLNKESHAGIDGLIENVTTEGQAMSLGLETDTPTVSAPTSEEAARQMKRQLLRTFDHGFNRLATRLEGLSDAEYLWEPVANCMTIRRTPEGLMPDPLLPPDVTPQPFTTIAWRMDHISRPLLASYTDSLRAGRLIRHDPAPCPESSTDAIRILRENYEGWRRAVGEIPDARLLERLGPDFGPLGEYAYSMAILLVLYELLHHGAEIGVVRDLYANHFST